MAMTWKPQKNTHSEQSCTHDDHIKTKCIFYFNGTGGKCFTKLDLAHTYLQIALDDDSK